MSLPVAWTDEAKETFELTVNQIENKWGIHSAEKFVRNTQKVVGTITTQPYLFKASYTKYSQGFYN